MINSVIGNLTKQLSPDFSPDQMDGSEDISCRPYSYSSTDPGYYCDYVTNQSAICSGGGYLFWTQYVVCETNIATKAFIILGSVLFLFFLFFLMAIVADEFLSKNIEVIVDKLNISQNIAGVTLMAFANGAPDVFTAIASVVGADRPQADLALSSLLGAAIFDGSAVFAAIVLIKPFTIMRRPIIRDIIFFLIGMGWLAVIMFHANQVFIWEPAVFLGLYFMYTLTVIFGRVFFVREIGTRQLSWISNNVGAKPDSFIYKLTKIISKYKKGNASHEHISNEGTIQKEIIPKAELDSPTDGQDCADLDSPATSATGLSEIDDTIIKQDPSNHVIITVNLAENDNEQENEKEEPIVRRKSVIRESGKFFIPEEEGDMIPEGNIEDEVFEDENKMENNDSKKSCRCPNLPTCFRWLKRIFKAIKRPAIEILALTIPLADQPWSRSLVILQCFTSPLLFMWAFQCLNNRIENGPYVWLLVMIGSIVVATIMIWITNRDKEPRFYQLAAAFIGFILAAVWIYELANEIVDVVTMLGVILNISNDILGVTIIAWANSIGDFVADTAVARKGFPRMGISAVIGGPLYNVFFGFGISFLIAKLQNKHVSLRVDTPLKIMLIAQSTSLITNLTLIIVQRFRLRRFHGIILICLYITFLVLVVLAELHVIVF
uniref:Sodium/calcium exchanger membrane region domain-containing protein n=1 Tax=Acrobeloides nanus TaxID=290746 RepID=A0A914CRD4_9BILA